MEQKAADKLNGADGILAEPALLSILVPETDLALFQRQKATVGDRHTVGVSGEVFKDILWLLNGFPHTDHPLVPIELGFEGLVIDIKAQLAGVDSACEPVDELAAKDQREGLLIEQDVGGSSRRITACNFRDLTGGRFGRI